MKNAGVSSKSIDVFKFGLDFKLKMEGNYSAPKIPGIMQEFQQRQVLQLQKRLFHVFLLSRYKNGF